MLTFPWWSAWSLIVVQALECFLPWQDQDYYFFLQWCCEDRMKHHVFVYLAALVYLTLFWWLSGEWFENLDFPTCPLCCLTLKECSIQQWECLGGIEKSFFFLNQWFYSCWHCSVLLIKLDIVCVCVNFWWKEGSVCVVWLKKNPWSNCSWLIIKVFLPNCSFVFCHLFFPSWYPIFDWKHLGSWEIFIVWTGSYSYRVQMA